MFVIVGQWIGFEKMIGRSLYKSEAFLETSIRF